MINNSTILDCFDGLVGWRDSALADSEYPALDSSLTASSSGVYVNDLPGITLQIINDAFGVDYSTASDYLIDTYHAAVIELMNNFVRSQKTENYTKSLIKNQDAGVTAKNVRTTIVKNNRFVGWEIIPRASNSISAEILQLGGMFNTIQANLPIYFYSSQQLEPVGIYYTDISKTNSTQWFTLNGSGSTSETEDPLQFICDYINDNNGHGQRYYIGYYEADLTGNAIYTQMPCSTCNSSSTKRWDIDKYVIIRPCEVAAGNTYGSRELFDLDAIGFSEETYGLFLKANVRCNVSQVLCDNKNLLANVLQKKIASKVLWDAYNATKVNANNMTRSEKVRLMAEKYDAELNGYVADGRRVKGEIEALTIDFSGLDETCLGQRRRALGIAPL